MKKIIVLILIALGAAYYYHYLDSLADGMGFASGTNSNTSTKSAMESSSSPSTADGTSLQEAIPQASDIPALDGRRETQGATSADQIMTIRTVDTETQEPIAGATVFFLVNSDVSAESLDSMGASQLDIDAIFKRFGREQISDAQGETRFPWTGEAGGAFAQMGAMRSEFEATDETGKASVLVLKMQQEKGVVVQVVDVNGYPIVGVPVALRVKAKAFDGPDMEMTVVTRASEGKEGIVRFTGVLGLMKFDSDPNPKYSVRIEVPGLTASSHPVIESMDPNDVVVLTLHDAGPLEVRTFSATGEPLALQGRVSLTAKSNSGGGDVRSTKPLVDGVARFEHVGLGSKVEVEVESKAQGILWKTSGNGPTSALETTVIRVQSKGLPAVVGRMLNEDGTPLANSPWTLHFLSEERVLLHEARCRTDQNGGFRMELPKKLSPGKEVGIMLVSPHTMNAKARADLSGMLMIVDGEMELGNFTAKEIQGSISGRCIDPEGNPLSKIQISIRQDIRMGSSARSNENGEFNISGVFPNETMLEVKPGNWILPAPIFIPVDGSEIELVLYPAGQIFGTLEIPPEMADQDFAINVALSDPDALDTIAWKGFCEVDPKDGSFSIGNLPPGEYSLSLGAHPSSLEATLTGITVSIGENCLDPRLHPWRFGDDLHTAKFRVVGTNGQRVIRPSLAVFHNGKQSAHASGKGSTLECTYGNADQSTMVVSANGCRPAILEGRVTETVVALETGIKVTLSTTRRPALKQGNKTASMSLQWQNENPLLKSTGDIWLPDELLESGQCVVVFPGPGSYRLAVSISEPTQGGFFMASVDPPLKNVPAIHIVEASAGSQVEIQLPASLFED